MLNLANPAFCGKWKVLRKLLRLWHDNGDKVLSSPTYILQHLFDHTSYTVSYLDGFLSYTDHDFNSDPRPFIFLIFTKVSGIGVNITSANKSSSSVPTGIPHTTSRLKTEHLESGRSAMSISSD